MTEVDRGTLKPAHHGTIEPDDSLGVSLHQVRAAAIDWSRAPAWAVQYRTRYNHLLGRTDARWIGHATEFVNSKSGDTTEHSEEAPVFFGMAVTERGLAITFGESQGAKEVVPVVRVRQQLIEAESYPGESTTEEIRRAIDWSKAPAWAAAWVANHTAGKIHAYWIDDNEADMRHEDAPIPAGVTMNRGRVVGINRGIPNFGVVK